MDGSKWFNPYMKVPPEEEIVISGIAGRFPGSDNIKELQENLLHKVDLGSDDDRRWNNVNYDMPARSGKTNNGEKFDAQYFNMTSSEAHVTDPMCRMLLEHTYEAIVDAGINPKELRGTKTGVFVGSCYSATANIILYHKPQVAGYPFIGCSKYWLANSISHWLGLNGPSYVVDTACSSSHYAMAEAYRMIRNGECDAAIVGGSNLCLHPHISHQFFRLGVLSVDGYCKPFDESGTGYMRSEAIAIVYLQKAKDARRIYATYVYAKTNSDGFKQEGITYPSFSMQKKLLEEFYNECDVAPEMLSYMEAHGTGTPAGDPVEVDAIDQSLCSKRSTPLLMGSVKSNLGHSEPTSGLCQVAKVLIAMETGIIPPNMHYETPRKEITAICEGRIKIITEPTSWGGGYVGINSFGFGGGNCHVLLKSNPKNKIKHETSDDLPRLVLVSGRTEEAVKTLLDDVNSRQLDVEYIALLHRLHAENIEGHPYRGYTIAGSQISQLMKLPMFAKAIETCNATLKQYNICVTDILTNENITACDSILKSFVAIIATQIGMVDLLTHVGIVPDYIIGHSIGNLICEYIDGRFTVEETILMAYYMGVAFEQANIQVNDATNNYNSLETVRSKFLELLSYILSSQSLKSRGLIWLGRSRNERDNTPANVAAYYADSILYPIPFQEVISLIPKNTVLVEIIPHSGFEPTMAKSLESTLISLCNRDQNTIQSFFQGIGDLYNIGFQPQIANLYPPVEFPVSRGTPMISPLVRWDHSEDYYFFRYEGQQKIYSRERIVNITITDEDFDYMSGHVIDGKNLLPATGYLYLIWEMIGLLNGIDHCNIPIVFENVKFVRATHLTKNNLELTLMIQEGINNIGNNFEIIEGDNVIVSGVVRIPDNIANEKLPAPFRSEGDDTEECMCTADIYKELRLRGYQYTGLFRSLKSATITGMVGHIKWQANWVAFMDNMLQMIILSFDSRSIYLPTQIRKLIIDPTYHMMQLQKLSVEERILPVRVSNCLDVIISGGIEIYGLKATSISRRMISTEAVHEEYSFVAYRDHAAISLERAVKMAVHIALECYEMINVKMMEFLEDDDMIQQDSLITPIIQEVLNNLPLVRSNLTLVAAANRYDSSVLPSNLTTVQLNKLAKDDKFLMIIAVGVLKKGTRDSTNQLLSRIMAGGFLLTREDLNGSYDHALLQRYDLNIIMEKSTEGEVLVLLRKAQRSVRRREIVHVNNHEFSWIDKLKSAMEVDDESGTNARVIVVAEGDPECGVLGLVNCLRKEPGGEIVRCIFIQDKDALEFSLQEPFYMNQLQLDLPINVLRPGNVWGSYRHFSLPLPEPRLVRCGYVVQKVRGDLSTLRWVEGSHNIEPENLVRIVYTTLNFKDVMIATGKLALESLAPVGRDVDSLLGFEFVGIDSIGRRIMGICSDRAISNTLLHHNAISWIIPDEWTLEDAATVPCVYATCYYSLYKYGKIKKGEKVLIHSGSGGIGQAAINLALHEGCEVFTTVGTPEKRQFIRETFPCIPDDHIGSSRDTSFEQMIVRQTRGRGVDIVLNSLAEEKLQASLRCLARGGRFLEIGKYDLISNNVLNKMAFARGISFHGIMLDRIISAKEEMEAEVFNYLLEGLRNHVIKPLPRKTFERTEVEDAFRYMATGKHIGKIVIKIRDEDNPLEHPILAHPRFFCEIHKSYVILGGLGGFGLELADWLILRGARKLLLTSRTGIRNGYQRSRVELWKSYGADVQIVAGADASDRKDCAFILKSAAKMGPVDVIFNLAVVLRDSIYKNQTVEAFEESFKPKAMATKTLDELSREMCPDLRRFVVFSSVSCGRGNAGQTNYGMANSIMERICEKRVQDGLPGMAIQWGAVGDVGLVADMQEDNNKELIIGGTLQQRIQSCLDSLDAFLMQSRPIVGSMVVAEKRAGFGGVMNILETVANVMGVKDLKAVGHRTPLSELGMDSMMAVEIKQTLEREFDVYLTAQDIRNLTFAKLSDMADKDKRFAKDNDFTVDSEGGKLFIRLMSNLVMVPDVCLEMPTKQKKERDRVFFLPGVEGCGSVFNTLASEIQAPATCLQHGTNNIPTCESVVESAAILLPQILTRMKHSKEFIIVGYSYGSVIAIELVRLLEARNLTGRLILIDGAPDQMKAMKEQHFLFTTIQDFQNKILLALMDTFYVFDNAMVSVVYCEVLMRLSKYNTWEEKLNVFIDYIPDKAKHVASIENYKIYCTSIYKHLLALHEYDASSLPSLKSPILLLKPTLASLSSAEEDYGLSKVTEGLVQVHYVEGNHITMLDNYQVAAAINGDIFIN
ncbi:PREDICTED: fatty acid synthase-like [Dinoponera quadriceps]|uniref:Fatty acid synthase-like n=1 Tax=Dinoponera quadriceps TaxID=609295 RepID=A0A6P3XW51_DINQU|nr:PREDICTED: fatty acid synthase-like [Dinoponera quadriceps]